MKLLEKMKAAGQYLSLVKDKSSKVRQKCTGKLFQKPWVYFWFPPCILVIVIEMTAFSAQHLIGLPYRPFPESWVILYYHLCSPLWFLAVASFVLFATTALGLYGFIARIKYAEFLILIPLFFILAIILSNVFWAIFNNTAINFSPFTLFYRYEKFGHNINFFGSTLIGLVLSGIMVLYPSIRRVIYAKDVYGHSRFSTLLELYQAGMLQKKPEGILLGTFKRYFRFYSNGFTHLLVLAPSEGGKTTGLAIPNLFTFEGSVITTDLKCTLHEKTSGYREKFLGNECYLFAPADPDFKTHSFNCFDSVSSDRNKRIAELQKIAGIVIPDADQKSSIWTKTARELMVAISLYLLDVERRCSLAQVAETIKRADFDAWLADRLKIPGMDRSFYIMASGYLGITANETRSGILFQLGGQLGLYLDPIIKAATSKSDFDLRDLRKKKMTIYLGIPQNELNRLAPLLNLFWELATSFMNSHVPDIKNEPYPVLFNMDEFGNLGRLNELRINLNLMREYRVRCVIFFQYLAQAEEHYSKAEAAAFRNLKTKVVFCQSDMQDAEYVSKLSGMKTVRFKNKGQSTNSKDQSQSLSEQIIKRPLIDEDVIRRIKNEEMFVFIDGKFPIKADKIFFYKDKLFKKMTISPSFVPVMEVAQTFHSFGEYQFKKVEQQKIVKAKKAAKKNEAAEAKNNVDF